MLQNCGIDAHRRLYRLLTRPWTCYGAQYVLHLVSPLNQNRTVLSTLFMSGISAIRSMDFRYPGVTEMNGRQSGDPPIFCSVRSKGSGRYNADYVNMSLTSKSSNKLAQFFFKYMYRTVTVGDSWYYYRPLMNYSTIIIFKYLLNYIITNTKITKWTLSLICFK